MRRTSGDKNENLKNSGHIYKDHDDDDENNDGLKLSREKLTNKIDALHSKKNLAEFRVFLCKIFINSAFLWKNFPKQFFFFFDKKNLSELNFSTKIFA